MRISLIVLYVSDLEAAQGFYGDILGLPLVQEQHGGGPEHYSAELDHGLLLELYPAGGKPPTRTRLSLLMLDVATAADEARAVGYVVRPMKRGVLVTGPDGVTVELRQDKESRD